jgi:hypothetical protein
MPNRILRDGILSSEKLAGLGWAEEVFYRRLMSVADDYGRFHALPKLIRSACYPLLIDRVSDGDVTGWLASCASAGLVKVYAADDGKRYIEIANFGQQLRAKSKFPDASASSCEQVISGASSCAEMIGNEHLDVFVFGVGVGDVCGVGDVKPPYPPAEAAPVEPPAPPAKPATRAKRSQSVSDPEPLPEWIDVESWEGWIESRKAKRNPLTPAARKLAIRDLEKLRGQGQDAKAVIEQSTLRGWTGLFPVKAELNGHGPPARKSAHSGFDLIDYSEGVDEHGRIL